ncbi:MAG: hypothetical protein L0387_16875 [Acidobacteria bacterium]|nr:hypothetical protein [Acidobacteriota bacterium]
MDDLICEVAKKHDADADLLRQLIDYEQTKVHLERRRGAKDELCRFLEKHIEEKDK